MAASMPNPEMIKKNKEDIATLNAKLMDASIFTFTTNNTQKSIKLTNSFRGVLFATSAYSNERGIWQVIASSSGDASTFDFVSGSGITFDTNTSGYLKVTSTHYVAYALLAMNGTASN